MKLRIFAYGNFKYRYMYTCAQPGFFYFYYFTTTSSEAERRANI